MSNKTERKSKRLAAQAAVVESPSVTESVAPAAPQTVEAAPKASIRQTIRQGILGGMNTKDLTAIVQAEFPGSAAARKPNKHIAHYRCLLKKEAKVAATAVQAVAE